MHSAFYFLVALALLVVVHEFGHFWVARRCGVKVLKFSVGFGRPLWRRLGNDGTEYILAMIPLGGFVKMLDEREGPVAEDELSKSFNRQPLWARVAIVAAGPIANILFAIAAYWLIFIVGVPGLKPIIDDVKTASPAYQAQLLIGDEIQAVNGKPTPTWQTVYKALAQISAMGGEAELTIISDHIQQQRNIVIPKIDLADENKPSLFEQVGLSPLQLDLLPVIDSVIADSAADKAGLIKGDKLIAFDGSEMASWSEWVQLIRSSANKPLNITIERNNDYVELILTPAEGENGNGIIGARVDASATSIPKELQSKLQYGPIDAVYYACLETWEFTVATLKSLIGMLNGSVSTENLGGPISIAQYAGSSAQQGMITFIGFLAMISISLGILNLLPIPVLDGGHLMLYMIEAIKGSPVSEVAQLRAQNIGVTLLLMLMLLAFFNDLTRLFG